MPPAYDLLPMTYHLSDAVRYAMCSDCVIQS
jgi:hypothetical protein